MAPLRRTITAAALVALATALAACGGDDQVGSNQTRGSGTYPVSVSTSWPRLQYIDGQAVLRIDVTNTGSRSLPDVTVTLTTGDSGTAAPAFGNVDTQPDLAEKYKSVWMLTTGPAGGDTSLANSWSLGSLSPGQTKRFEWHVHPVITGPHRIHWVVAPAMLGGEAVLADGSQATGLLDAVISAKAPTATVNPKTGKVTKNFGRNPQAVEPPDAAGGASPGATTTTGSSSGGAGVP